MENACTCSVSKMTASVFVFTQHTHTHTHNHQRFKTGWKLLNRNYKVTLVSDRAMAELLPGRCKENSSWRLN